MTGGVNHYNNATNHSSSARLSNFQFTNPILPPTSAAAADGSASARQHKNWNFGESPMYKILANILTAATNNSEFFGDRQFDQQNYHKETLRIFNDSSAVNYFGNGTSVSDNSSNSSGNTDNDNSYDLTRLLFIIIAGTVLSLVTAGGNLLVLLSFKIDKQLRTISNYFLFSLGVADLTVGLVSIPLMTLYTAEGKWTLGYAACQVWLSVDYLMSNASVCNLLLISFDRFFSLIRPLTYRPRRTKKKAFIMIALTFIVSLVLWPPWIVMWPYIENQWVVADNECIVQFLITNKWVTLGTAILAFYLPVVIMVVLYAGVFYVTQTRHRELAKLQAFQKKTTRSGGTGASTGGSGHRRSLVTAENSQQKLSEYSSLHQTDTYNEFSDGQPDSNRVLGRTKSWGIQTIVDHFTNRRLRSSFFKRNSIISSGFEEESNVSGGSGDFPIEEDTPLRQNAQTQQQSQDAEKNFHNRWRNRSSGNKKLSSRKKSNVQHQRQPSQKTFPLPVTSAANIETPLLGNNSVETPLLGGAGIETPLLSNNSVADESANLHNCSDQDTDSTYTVLIHLTNNNSSTQSPRGPSITLYDDTPSEPKSAPLTPPIRSQRSHSAQHPAVAAIAATEAALKRHQSVLSDSASDVVTPGGHQVLRVTESNSLKSKDSLPSGGLMSLLPGGKLAQVGSLGSAAKRKQRSEKKQESKAAKTLSAILLAFIVTWTPYNVIVCVEAFLPNTVPNTWFTFSYYLCYINSTVNPVLYAMCNVNFRRCFFRILKCQWSKRHDRTGKDNSSLGLLIKK